MKFKFRLAYYLLGLFIGVLGVAYFLSEKANSKGVEFCYFPNCRVLQDLRKKPLHISKKADSILALNWVCIDDIKISLNHGNVDFSQSNIAYKNGKKYLIEGQTSQHEKIIITMVNYSEKVLLDDIKKK